MNPKAKLRIVFAESILGSAGIGLCVPIMVVFWNGLGMNQALIGISQMVFTIAILFADIPMGYIADKYSRKKMNIIGDFGVALTFIIYAISGNFWMVVLCEILCGITIGMTNGVDRSFVKFYSDKIDGTGELFKKNNARLTSYQFFGLLLAVALGMFISKIDLRLVIGAVALPFIIAGILACFIDDIGEKATSSHRNHIKDMIENVKTILKNQEIKWYIFAYAVANKITHPIIWVFTPLLIIAGVPVWLVGIGWIMNYVFSTIGTLLARRTLNLKPSTRFIIPMGIATLGMLPIIADVNIITVWFFVLTGLAQGFPPVSITPIIQQKTQDKFQTTVISIAATSARLLYIPLVSITNWAGNINPQYTLTATLAIMLPLVMIIFAKLKRFEKE